MKEAVGWSVVVLVGALGWQILLWRCHAQAVPLLTCSCSLWPGSSRYNNWTYCFWSPRHHTAGCLGFKRQWALVSGPAWPRYCTNRPLLPKPANPRTRITKMRWIHVWIPSWFPVRTPSHFHQSLYQFWTEIPTYIKIHQYGEERYTSPPFTSNLVPHVNLASPPRSMLHSHYESKDDWKRERDIRPTWRLAKLAWLHSGGLLEGPGRVHSSLSPELGTQDEVKGEVFLWENGMNHVVDIQEGWRTAFINFDFSSEAAR